MRRTSTVRPVISRHSSVVSRSDRLTCRAPADVERRRRPTAPGPSSCSSISSSRSCDVEQVSDLLAGAAEADVRQRPPEVMSQHPVREHALVDLAHLPRAGRRRHSGRSPCRSRTPPAYSPTSSSAASLVAPYSVRVPSSGNVSAIPRELTPGRACWSDSSKRGRPPRVAHPLQRRHRVYPARRQEHELGARAARQLQAVVGAEQVRVDDVVGAAVDPGQHRWLGRALHQRVDVPERPQIVQVAHVAVLERHARVGAGAAGSAPSRGGGGCRGRRAPSPDVDRRGRSPRWRR